MPVLPRQAELRDGIPSICGFTKPDDGLCVILFYKLTFLVKLPQTQLGFCVICFSRFAQPCQPFFKVGFCSDPEDQAASEVILGFWKSA